METFPVTLTDAVCRDQAWANSAFLTIDADGMIQHANRRCEEMFGACSGGLYRKKVEELMPVPSRANHPKLRAMFFEESGPRAMNQSREVEALKVDGVSTMRVRVTLSKFYREGQPFVQAGIVESANENIIQLRK